MDVFSYKSARRIADRNVLCKVGALLDWSLVFLLLKSGLNRSGLGPQWTNFPGSFGFSNRHCDRVFVIINVNISGKIVYHPSPFLTAQLYATASENGHLIYLFLRSEAGGKSAAIAYTLIETAKMNKVNPEAWLTWVLERIQDHPVNRINDLMPRAYQNMINAQNAEAEVIDAAWLITALMLTAHT